MSKVLVVDDDPDVVTLTRDLLASLDLEALSAESYDAALQLWDEHAPEINLVLLDFTLGDRTGGELAEELLAAKPALAIVLITGLDADTLGLSDELRARVKFLPKPFTVARFRTLLRQLAR
jgi:two-component system, cell cycle sensor histidine kinase and response regulator CckA